MHKVEGEIQFSLSIATLTFWVVDFFFLPHTPRERLVEVFCKDFDILN